MYDFLISYDKNTPHGTVSYHTEKHGPNVYLIDTRKEDFELVQIGIYFHGTLLEIMQFTNCPPGATLDITIPPRVGNEQFPWSLQQ
jgi:hypothetical protein